jgi:hypothetical protein
MILSVVHTKILLTLAESFFGEVDIHLPDEDFCCCFILCSVSFIVCVVLCAVFCLSVVCYLCDVCCVLL